MTDTTTKEETAPITTKSQTTGAFTSTTVTPTLGLGNVSTTTTTPEVNATDSSTANVTQTHLSPSTSYTSTEKAGQPTDGDGGSKAGLIGGCIGGVLAVVIIMIVVILLIKRKRRHGRKGPKIPTLPDKDFVDSIHLERAVHHHRVNQPIEPEDGVELEKRYVNVTRNGETDEHTDPAVGPDGYLKKTKNFFAKHKQKKHKKHKNYANIPNKTSAKRTDSMPYDEAPPPPRDSVQYTEGRVADTTSDAAESSNYMNVQNQKKAAAAGVTATQKSNSKEHKKKGKNVEEKVLQTSDTDHTNETGQQKFYENLQTDNYYNLKGENQAIRQSYYENFENKTDSLPQADDVYENP